MIDQHPQQQPPAQPMSKGPVSHQDTANLLMLATGSALVGFIARSFPVFRLWLGIIPIVVVGVGLLAWGLFPHLKQYAKWSQQRVGQLRAHGPAFWSMHRLIMAFGPFAVFAVLVTIGALL